MNTTTEVPVLTLKAAYDLCDTMRRTILLHKGGKRELRARIEEATELRVRVVDGRSRWEQVQTGRIVFEGASTGTHSILIDASTETRALAHWEGYCENNGCLKPTIGQKVQFPSGSAWKSGGGYRTGRVTHVGSKRATVEYMFKHGGRTTKVVPFNELRMYEGAGAS